LDLRGHRTGGRQNYAGLRIAFLISKSEGTGTRYVFTALNRKEADLEANKTSGWLEGTNIAVDQLVELVQSMK
jgi:hypothetical protein